MCLVGGFDEGFGSCVQHLADRLELLVGEAKALVAVRRVLNLQEISINVHEGLKTWGRGEGCCEDEGEVWG